MKSYILLENLTFYANHGVLAQETTVGNVFVINLKIEVDLLKSCQSDDLSDTVSYADVYEIVKNEINIPSKLLEHAAYRIIKRLKNEYSRIHTIELKLAKRNPPLGIGSQADYASILLID